MTRTPSERTRDDGHGTPIGIDTGGTFTDVAILHPGADPTAPGTVQVVKVPSTPTAPGAAVLAGLDRARAQLSAPEVDLVHGTTVGLNAILTGRLGRVAWVTNAGFEDLIEIGRQQRDDLYALEPTKATPSIPREHRFGVPTRRTAQGERLAAPTTADLDDLRSRIASMTPDAIAIGLLHAHHHPEDEHEIASALDGLGVPITCSADLLSRQGEYERFAAAILNAGIRRVVGDYLDRLSTDIAPGRLRLLRSSGGILPIEEAIEFPARAVFSGPAGGVVATRQLARRLGIDTIAAFDMGGTSTDVCLVSDTRPESPDHQREIAGIPLPLPSFDVHTVGCGGGSIAFADSGGALRVGPRSAGADPGPACYGKGDEPTVTDAHMALGHMGPNTLLGGEFPVDPDASIRAIERLAKKLGLDTERTARGILEIAETEMLRALLVITVERAIDPETVPLCAYGGAGGLHAASLAHRLGMPEAIVPPAPGAFSAVGLALAGESVESIHPVHTEWSEARSTIGARFAAMLEDRAPVVDATQLTTIVLRYAGQGGGLALRWQADPGIDWPRRFDEAHQTQFGFTLQLPVEVVELRLRTEGPPRAWPGFESHGVDQNQAVFDANQGTLVTNAWKTQWRGNLAESDVIQGPALIGEPTGWTVVPPGFRAAVDSGCLRIRAGSESAFQEPIS